MTTKKTEIEALKEQLASAREDRDEWKKRSLFTDTKRFELESQLTSVVADRVAIERDYDQLLVAMRSFHSKLDRLSEEIQHITLIMPPNTPEYALGDAAVGMEPFPHEDRP
jgi:chromosome segregation ATPase